jgi:hypothetical protein
LHWIWCETAYRGIGVPDPLQKALRTTAADSRFAILHAKSRVTDVYAHSLPALSHRSSEGVERAR